MLQGAELNYQKIEQLAYAVVVSARKVRPDFQSHTVSVLTDQALRQVLQTRCLED